MGRRTIGGKCKGEDMVDVDALRLKMKRFMDGKCSYAPGTCGAKVLDLLPELINLAKQKKKVDFRKFLTEKNGLGWYQWRALKSIGFSFQDESLSVSTPRKVGDPHNVNPGILKEAVLLFCDSDTVVLPAPKRNVGNEGSRNNQLSNLSLIEDVQGQLSADDYEEIEGEIQSIAEKLESLPGTDVKREVLGRLEQSLLRNALLGKRKMAKCGICQKEYPADLLVAAHIKRRADCSEDERRDLKNNLMLMCKFGCDDLFEKGYIGVENGKMAICSDRNLMGSAREYAEALSGKTCISWSKCTREYFAWHYQNKFRK